MVTGSVISRVAPPSVIAPVTLEAKVIVSGSAFALAWAMAARRLPDPGARPESKAWGHGNPGAYPHPIAPGPVQPIFVVSAPFSGAETLLHALSAAGGLYHAPGPLDLGGRVAESHRLTTEDAAGGRPGIARENLRGVLVDREGRKPAEGAAIRAVAGGPRLALRIAFLHAAFPDARFVWMHREPADTAIEMLAAWRSGRWVSEPDLPGWDGEPWSLPLVPGWRELSGVPLDDVVAEQWRAIVEIALADLQALPAGAWAVADHATLLADPRGELRRLTAFLGVPYDQALLTPVEAAARAQTAQAVPAPDPALATALERTEEVARRARELLADGPDPAPRSRAAENPFGSVATASVPRALARQRASLLVSTYQSGKLICARDRGGVLNTHFRDFDKPMGIARDDGRFALATRTEVWDFRDMPAVAPKVEPAGTHDACYLPWRRHTTGDTLAHEMAYVDGELWLVATAFSCLATLDADHSFVPRWTPPFITGVEPGDRCHLNGLALKDGRLDCVTALGTTDEPGGWRPGKATGGVIIDIATKEIVVGGLSMPHSPRWHDGRLWVLESGRGELCVVDPEAGRTETVVELPGFTRGLVFAGGTAFVGLSQIRESSTFGDLPLTQRLEERVCGVWMVDLASGTIAGFLRFEDLVQEIFDVTLLPFRNPEIAEPGSTAVSTSYVLP